MAAIAHGWHPTGLKHAPSQAVATEFNQADKGSALLSHAMQHHHAAGGAISPLAQLEGNPMSMRSSMPHLGHPMGMGNPMRLPHVPLAGTLHNIDQHMGGARMRMPALRRGGHYDAGGEVNSSSPGSPGVGGAVKDALAALKDYMIDRPRRELQAAREANENAVVDGTYTGPTQPATPQQGDYAQGGPVPQLPPQAVTAIRNALAHLKNKDASSAAATLHASPHAMQHPVVRLAAHALQTGQGLAPATQGLTQMGASQPSQMGG
jgi:hypothetical protein